MAKDYKKMYSEMKTSREPFILKAQAIGEYVKSSITVKNYSSKDFPNQIKTPFSQVGPRCNKGIASIINNVLNPPNLSSFKLENNIKFELQKEESNLLDSLYIGIEKIINGFKAQHNYKSYQYQALEYVGIHGTVATKVSESGYMMYGLDSFVVSMSRNSGKPEFAIFEETITDDEGKPIPQYIYVNYNTDEVWLQINDKRPERMEDESAVQYIISSQTYVANQNYMPSIFADYYGILKSINKTWELLEESQSVAAHNYQTFTGPASISTSSLSKIPRNSVIRVPNHDVLRWQGVDSQKLNSWNWVSTLVVAREQEMLNSFGIGLLQRAGQLQTATEVRAVINELMALTGPIAIQWSETFTAPILRAEMFILDVKNKLKNALNAKGLEIPEDVKDKIMVPVVISGVSAFARSENAEQMLTGIAKVTQAAANIPEALQQIAGSIRYDQVLKSYLDNIGVDTSSIIKEYVPPEQQQTGPQLNDTQLAAANNLPRELIDSLPENIRNAGPETIAQYLLNQ